MEKLILVDEHDVPIGTEEKLKTHQSALCHRAFSVFVFRHKNGKRQLLIHQREKNKYHCGDLWTNTTCGHPRPNEETINAATRRLKEEMGFIISLTAIGTFHYIAEFKNGLTENEIDHVFTGEYKNEKIQPDPHEVQDYRWLDIDDLKRDLQANPKSYTPWFSPAFELTIKKT